MKYIYGPVKSRRLGFSLGLSPVPYKTCNFDCLYCQLGRSAVFSSARKEYTPIEEVFAELNSWLQNNPQEAKTLDYITISGSGEPLLNIRIGDLISRIKQITAIPVAVITNASLLNDISVRRDILSADLIVPSLDAVVQDVFKEINRPAGDLNVQEVIRGLTALRKEFRGKIWLEVMLAKGINDDLRYIKKLETVIEEIRPDKIQLNSPVRATSECGILPVERKKLEKIKAILGERCEII